MDIKRRIGPIKNARIQINQNTLASHLVKRQKARVWEFHGGDDFNNEVMKKTVSALKFQNKAQKMF